MGMLATQLQIPQEPTWAWFDSGERMDLTSFERVCAPCGLSSSHPTPYSGIRWKPAPSSMRNPERMNDEILTVLEVAALLKVADKTVYTMAQKGEIPAFKVRGQWRFRRLDIDAWIQEQTTPRRDDGGRHE